MKYSRASWHRAGSAADLDPLMIPTDPTAYNRETYRWLATRYRHMFLDLHEAVRADGALLREQPPHFAQHWAIYYDPISIWKQVCPLFVFAQALGGIDARHLQLARAYTLGYGVPVMAVDRMIDTLPGTPHLAQTWLFVLASYALGLERIQMMDAPGLATRCFLRYTQQMHHFFWEESKAHYQLPEAISAPMLVEYVEGKSRLLSSIFFGLTIEWAFLLSEGRLPPEIEPALIALRKVRQLNDELVDADEDIRYGIVTFPYLHGLASTCAVDLAENVRATWALDRTEPGSPEMEALTQQRRRLLQQAGSFEAGARASMSSLRTAMHAVMVHLPPENAFDVTLLINQRLSHLFRLALNNWQEIPDVYQPEPFAITKESVIALSLPG